MRPIYLLGSEELEEEELPLIEDPVKTHKLAVEIESAIPHIYRYWLPHRKSAVETVRHETPKPGRNDVCSCGSGKNTRSAAVPDKLKNKQPVLSLSCKEPDLMPDPALFYVTTARNSIRTYNARRQTPCRCAVADRYRWCSTAFCPDIHTRRAIPVAASP